MTEQSQPDKLTGPGAGLSTSRRQADDFDPNDPTSGTDYGGTDYGNPAVGDPNVRTRPGKDPDAADGNPAALGDAAQPYGPTETEPA